MFTLDHVVPWGRSFAEYLAMFQLSEADLASSILGCGDGPASFNVEATRRGAAVVSCDPIYRFSKTQLATRIADVYDQVLDQVHRNLHEFVWDTIPSVEALGQIRMQAMQTFLDDYPAGRAAGRYVEAALPTLPFRDDEFDLGLCSHLLFLYSVQLDEAFHLASMKELCRVSREVRVFPLLALDGVVSPHVGPGLRWLQDGGYTVSIERVPYEFQRGGNEMLRIRRGEGSVLR